MHSRSLSNNVLHHLTVIKLTVALFVGMVVPFVTRYSRGYTT